MFKASFYDPKQHDLALLKYMEKTPARNNRNAKILRLDECDGQRGTLILVQNAMSEIVAISTIHLEDGLYGKAAKIYGRFNILADVPHTVIDEFIEPLTFQWCERRGIQHLFLTVNEADLRTLDWVARRIGNRRAGARENPYFPTVGSAFRKSFQPLPNLVFERNCWQYVIFYSPSGRWFLKREQKALSQDAISIFFREFPNETQNCHGLFRDPADTQMQKGAPPHRSSHAWD
jgi:hypothetical protein